MPEKSNYDGVKRQTRRQILKKGFLFGLAATSELFTSAFVPHEGYNQSKDFLVNNGLTDLFINSTTNEEIIAKGKVEKQIRHYETNPDLPISIRQSLSWQDLVYQCAAMLDKPVSPFITSYLCPLIFVESEGNPNAINKGSKARGLCQIIWDTAQQAYDHLTDNERKKMGINPLETENLFNSSVNILLSLKILSSNYESFPDPSLAFWAYHWGEGNLTRAIRTYLTTTRKKNDQELDLILGDIKQNGTARLVKDYKISFLKLMAHPDVVERLKNDGIFRDDTEFYLPRIAAASHFLK